MAKILKGETRGRPGRWLVDYYDASGKRRLVTVRTRDEAKMVLERVLSESRQHSFPAGDPNLRVGDYAAQWLEAVSATSKKRTHEIYEAMWRLHLAPRFSRERLRTLHRGAIQAHLVSLLKNGKDRSTVRLIHAVFRVMLNAAIGEGLINANPADKIGRQLKLVQSARARQDEISVKALDRGQVQALLEASRRIEPGYYALLLTLARTGLRLGEVIGLEWRDVDIEGRHLTVSRATSHGITGTPKSGHGRVVDMSDYLADTLRRLLVDRKAMALRRGWGQVPARVFVTERGEPLTEDRIRFAMARVLTAAGFPRHHTPHGLRHTYASLMLQAGESPAYVQRQPGHASIQLTVDTYGKWLPMGNRAAANRLDGDVAIGGKLVAAGGLGAVNAVEMPVDTTVAEGARSISCCGEASRDQGGREGRFIPTLSYRLNGRQPRVVLITTGNDGGSGDGTPLAGKPIPNETAIGPG